MGQPLGAAITCICAVVTGFIVAYVYAYKLAWVVMLVFPFVLFGGIIEVSSPLLFLIYSNLLLSSCRSTLSMQPTLKSKLHC